MKKKNVNWRNNKEKFGKEVVNKDIANKINTFQANHIKDLRKGRINSNQIIKNQELFCKKQPQIENTLFLRDITIKHTQQLIKEVYRKKSVGYDNICITYLYETIENSSKFISKIINQMIAEEKIPAVLKVQIIRPLYKSGDGKDPSNYRPIAIMSVVEKIFEKYLHINIVNFLEKSNMEFRNQFAFQKKKSTNTAMKRVIDKFNEALSNNLNIGAVFFYCKKAFDTIDRDKLLEVLYKIGIRGKIYNIIRNYFEDRKIVTKIENEFSEALLSNFGIPQGSCLGPLLFIIYINDINDIGIESELYLYADDILIFNIHKDENIVRTRLQSDVNKIITWTMVKDLFINKEKTKLMMIQNYKIGNNKKSKKIMR